MKALLRIFVLLCLTSASLLAFSGKLVDLIVNESGLLNLLAKNGIEAQVSSQVRNTVKNSIISLAGGVDGTVPTSDQLIKVIKGLPNDPKDGGAKSRLIKVLDVEDTASLDKEATVGAINDLALLAQKYGTSSTVALACSQCNDGALAIHGFKLSVIAAEEFTQKSTQQVLTSIPRESRELNKFISRKFQKLKLGRFNARTQKLVQEEDEKALAIFLALAEKSSPATASQRRFINSVMEISKTKNRTILLDSNNYHNFWKFLGDKENNDVLLDQYTNVLNRTAEYKRSGMNTKDAFYKVLDDIAEDGPSSKKLEYVERLKSKNCFFK